MLFPILAVLTLLHLSLSIFILGFPSTKDSTGIKEVTLKDIKQLLGDENRVAKYHEAKARWLAAKRHAVKDVAPSKGSFIIKCVENADLLHGTIIVGERFCYFLKVLKRIRIFPFNQGCGADADSCITCFRIHGCSQ